MLTRGEGVNGEKSERKQFTKGGSGKGGEESSKGRQKTGDPVRANGRQHALRATGDPSKVFKNPGNTPYLALSRGKNGQKALRKFTSSLEGKTVVERSKCSSDKGIKGEETKKLDRGSQRGEGGLRSVGKGYGGNEERTCEKRRSPPRVTAFVKGRSTKSGSAGKEEERRL